MRRETEQKYRSIIAACKDIFEKKTKDYGTAWRILRPSSVTDQVFIKAQRIRSIQEKGEQKIKEDISFEFKGIINYSIIAMIQTQFNGVQSPELPFSAIEPKYDQIVHKTLDLLKAKDHDYGEAWRDMRLGSMTDIILMKLMRIKQIEDNQDKTLISDGVDDNYLDIINYSIFCLIKLGGST